MEDDRVKVGVVIKVNKDREKLVGVLHQLLIVIHPVLFKEKINESTRTNEKMKR